MYVYILKYLCMHVRVYVCVYVVSRALRPCLFDVGKTGVNCEYFFPNIFLRAILIYIERTLMHNFTYIVALQRYIFIWSL